MPDINYFEKPFTYDQGLSCSTKDYTLQLPDGFVLQEDPERDFTAYLGGEGITEASQSPFAIYSGKSQSHEVFQDKCIPQLYEAFAYAITCTTSARHSFDKLAFFLSENPQLPGGVSAGYDRDGIYYNAYLGCGGAIHPLRIDVRCSKDDRSACDDLVGDLIKHAKLNGSAGFLELPGDKLFVNYGVSQTLTELWDGNINANIKQMTLARNIRQNAMVSLYKEQQSKGKASLKSFKEDLTEMLSTIVRLADKVIGSAMEAYNAFAEQTEDSALMEKFRSSLRKLLDFADQSVVVSGEELCVVSELAAEIRKKLEEERKTDTDSDDFILAVTTEDDTHEKEEPAEQPVRPKVINGDELSDYIRKKKAEFVRDYKGRYQEADGILDRAINVAQGAIDDVKDSLALLDRSENDKKQELSLKLEEKEERLYQLQLKKYELKKKYIAAVKTLPAYLDELKKEKMNS